CTTDITYIKEECVVKEEEVEEEELIATKPQISKNELQGR
ncbi:hypothetical protein Csa_023657, partial [Cucumis sativus]